MRPLATGSLMLGKTIGIALEGSGRRRRVCQDDVGLQTDQLLGEQAYPIGVIAGPTNVHPHVAAIDPTQARKRLRERSEVSPLHGIVFVARHEHADAPDAVALLSLRHKRPHCRAPEPRDELPPSHP
jgi:hypothetical protein